MKNKYLSPLLYLVLFTMCNPKNDRPHTANTTPNKYVIDIPIDELDTETTITYSSIFSGYKLVPLETSEKCLIGQVADIVVFNDTIYILDSFSAKALYVFDINGNFIKKIGAVGRGPGQYLHPTMFAIDTQNNQVKVLDSGQKKILTFSLNGNFIHEFKLRDIIAQIVIQDNYIYADQVVSKSRKSDFLLYAMNNTGEIVAKWFPSELYDKGFEQSFGYSKSLFKTQDDIKYTKPLFDTIYSVTGNVVKPYIVISTNNMAGTKDIQKINSYHEVNEFFMYFSTKCDKFLGASNYVENSDLIMFQYRNKLKTHYLFYWTKNNTIICTTRLINDMVDMKYSTRFFSTYKNQFASCIENNLPGQMEAFIDNIKNKKIKLPKGDLSRLKKLTSASNPVVVFYECREEYKQQ